MNGTESKEIPRIAWLFPSLERGNYWHPIWKEFCKNFPNTVIYTGHWAGYSPGFEGTFQVEVVGETKFVATDRPTGGYRRSYILPSASIVKPLLQFRPNIIFTSAFSLWTLITLLLKPLLGWKVLVVFDGVSPGVDQLNSGARIYVRRSMVPLIDGFITNSQAAKSYLIDALKVKPDRIFTQPYLVPDLQALEQQTEHINIAKLQLQHPVFLYVGMLIQRKGVQQLLEACRLLKQKHSMPFTLLIVGDGEQKPALEQFVQERDLSNEIKFVGYIEYAKLGAYFRHTDVFVFPTLEDIWGMVVLEAMAFGKPILCSKWAASSEMIIDGENGFIFDPYWEESLSARMLQFLKQPDLISEMGNKSKLIIAPFNPKSVSKSLTELVYSVITN